MLSRSQLANIESEGSLFDTLARTEALSLDELRRAAAHVLGVPFVMLSRDDVALEALTLIPEPIARIHSVVAYKTRDGAVEVAVLDTDALEHIEFLRTERGFRILPRLTSERSIKQALVVYHKHLKEKFGEKIKGANDPERALEALLAHALLHRASEAHFEPREFLSGQSEVLVRYRIEGTLYEAMTLPREAVAIIAKLKELASLSYTLSTPQEGSFKVVIEGEEVRVRVVALPTLGGERVVLHLVPHNAARRRGFTLPSLGLHGEALESVHKILHRKSGLITVSGRGKTTLLYTLLDLLASPSKALFTVEEQIETRLPHITQRSIQREIGLDMPAAVRAVLKQDPDVVMIDSIADQKTAALAQAAAKRGVLVLAGLDTPVLSEVEGPERIPSAEAIIKVAVVRRACPECHESYKLSRAEMEPFEAAGANFGRVLFALKAEGLAGEDAQFRDVRVARATGCSQCSDGYKGNIGLQEVVVEGETRGLNIVEDALFKAAAGLTTIDEVAGLVQQL